MLWPDSAAHEARSALRNVLTLLRHLLDEPACTPASHSHLLVEHDLLGLNPQAPLELDLDKVQLAFKQAQMSSAIPSETEYDALVAQLQNAISLVRGPFLDGFWLREETCFDEWHQQQQEKWQVRLLTLCERLSAWQEATGEMEQARLTLTRWLSLDSLSEEASRRLMRVYVTQGDASSALQVYVTLQNRLAEALHMNPDAKTEALAEGIRATQASGGHVAIHSSTSTVFQPPGELVVPLVGRAAAFRDLVEHYQLAQAGQPQAVLLLGEAGIGKTRLANEFVAWARAQGADILSGHAFELGGRLPYQPLVEALRPRLEAENAPEDLLEDLWLAELARILPELQVRYPDLSIPTHDEFSDKLRLFEAVVRLLAALARRAPLVLLLEDLHWADSASLNLVRYLGHAWREHGSRVLLLCTVRSEGVELTPELAAQLSDLDRDLPLTQVSLPLLSQTETLQLLEALVAEGDHDLEQSFGAFASSTWERPLAVLSDFLFARTDGQPLYVLETLKLLRDRQWLIPQLTTDGVSRLFPTRELVAALARWRCERELVPPSVRALIQTRLAKLPSPARSLVQVSAVLGHSTSAYSLWQLADLELQTGVEALEEAVRSGILREEPAESGRPASYRITHELMRDVVYTELGAARRAVLHRRALTMLESEGVRVAELAYHALAAGEASLAYHYSVQAGDEARAVFAVEEAIGHYEQARVLLKTHQSLQSELSPSQIEPLYVCLERAYAFQNAWTSAQQVSEELLAYAQEHKLSALVSMTLNRLAVLAVQQTRDRSEVQALLEQAWQQAQSRHDQRTQAETAWNWAQISGILWANPKQALPHSKQAVALAREIADQELQARSLSLLGVIRLLGGEFEEAIPLLEKAYVLYAALDHEPLAVRKLSLPYFALGPPLTQPLTNRASEALCCMGLGMARLHTGQMQESMASSCRALALSRESKNPWAQVYSMSRLAYVLLETGEYETVLGLMQHAVALARLLPLTDFFPSFLTALGSVYQSLQQWEEARAALQEAVGTAERGGREPWRVLALSRLCLHYALTGEWETASRHALQAISLRKRANVSLIVWDFSSHAETEALLHTGEERQVREEVQRLGECLGSSQRFRLPYLRSLAALAEWHGHDLQASGYLREAEQLAANLGLPAERWQILARLARVYQARGDQKQARLAIGEAAKIIEGLAEGIKDETLRARYLAGFQIYPVLQQSQLNACLLPPR
ncbi:transcriptional activator [Reticulibacter mediterranei]|uniref:Transcriptional activator n=1 Tax=Reticulibacter mediterranei TaxID=2778369 RepID=A0A8J3IFQ1_9CHLR|nr:AAA family ATPase [Reticulibacter mediterranei]GHO92748.1 transcriptional activator [Reticulibacter mediterranei]